jgi:hypothetical protein
VQFEIEFGDRASVADVEITLSGVATPSAFRQLADTLARDPRFRAGLTMLVDLSALDTSALGDDDLQGITEPGCRTRLVLPARRGRHHRAERENTRRRTRIPRSPRRLTITQASLQDKNRSNDMARRATQRGARHVGQVGSGERRRIEPELAPWVRSCRCAPADPTGKG